MLNTLHKSLTIAFLAVSIFISGLSAALVRAQSSVTEPMVTLTAEEQAWLRENPHIRLATLTNQPPFSMMDAARNHTGNLAATNLQAAAVNLEKLVKGIEKKAPAVKKLNLRYSELENALNHALESVETPGIAAEEKAIGSSNEALAAIPADLVQEVTQRMRDAAQMGDVSGLNAIVEELKARSDTFTPLGNRIISLAEDFNFEGIIKLADDLDKL